MTKTYEITQQTTADTDILDITGEVEARVSRSGIRHGQVLVFTPGSTAAITTIEFEPGVVADLKAAIDRIAPREMHYDHDARWGDGNGYSHVRSALLGASFTLPVADGQVVRGTWQQVVLIDFDNRARQRRVVISVLGD